MPAPTSVLVVTDRIAVSPELCEAIRARAAQTPIEVRLLVPNPSPAEWHPGHPERHVKAEAAQSVLERTLPGIREAAGTPVDGFVSTRHDPMDAIEETLTAGNFHEIILSSPPHHMSSLLHADLPHRVAHLGMPLTTVTATARPALQGGTRPRTSET